MTLIAKVLEVAASFVGVRETKRNRGPEIDAWITAASKGRINPAKPGADYPWCRAFVFACFAQAAKEMGVGNPVPYGLSVMKMWYEAQPYRKSKEPKIGTVFVISHGRGKGHTGIVEHVGPLHLITIEGNTTDLSQGIKSREGDGVYRRTRRLDEILGFIDFGKVMPERVS